MNAKIGDSTKLMSQCDTRLRSILHSKFLILN